MLSFMLSSKFFYVNECFQLLRGQHEKLARQLAPPKAIDPLQILPLELAELTIKYLEFRHIVSVSIVSLSNRYADL